MDIKKIKVGDLLNPKKWVDFAAGTYYEYHIGYYKCEQLLTWVHAVYQERVSEASFDELQKLNDLEKIVTLSKEEWNEYKEKEIIVPAYENRKPIEYDRLDDLRDNLEEYFKDVPLYFAEQAVYRAYLCSYCLLKGSCEHCGCSTPDNFMAPTNTCSGGKWQSFYRSEEDWIVARDIYKHHIFVNYPRTQSDGMGFKPE